MTRHACPPCPGLGLRCAALPCHVVVALHHCHHDGPQVLREMVMEHPQRQATQQEIDSVQAEMQKARLEEVRVGQVLEVRVGAHAP